MSNPTSNRVRGELLREWRFSQKWDVVELARRVNLSIGQIQQLETGGTSLFYSTAIRENAAKKVAAMLGADPLAVIRMDDEPAAPGPEDKVVDDLIALSRQRAQAARQPSFVVRHASGMATVLLLMVGVFAAAGWLQQKWQNGGAQQFWREAAAPAAMAPATGQAQVLPAQAASELNEGALQKTVPLATASTAEVLVQPAPTAATAGVTPTPALASATVPTPTSAIAFAPPAAASTSVAVASAHPNPLCQQVSTGHAITPARPSKAGDMVYIVAQKIGSVCVVDAAGVHTVLSLKPQEARSVYGAAPWRVNFEQPEQAQLYFQGERLRVPGGSVTTVALHEASLSQ
ncbi:MAG: helix-turn-helix transcriptional regulator [Pseudomonadota bacterium]